MRIDAARRRDPFMSRLFTLGMETGGLLSLVGLLFLLPGTAPPPLLSLTAGLLSAAVLSGMLSGLRLRRLWKFLLHSLCFAVWFFFVTRAYPGLPFADGLSGTGLDAVDGWIAAFGRLKGAPQWAETVLLFSISFLFWFRGYRIGTVNPGYSITVRRFDTAFGLLLVVSLIRMGFRLADPDFPRFVFFSVLSGIAALISAKNLEGDFSMKKSRSPLGPGLFFIGLLIPAGAAFGAFYPLFVRTAERTYTLLQAGAETVHPWLIRLLLFLFQGWGRSPAGGTSAAGPSMEYVPVPIPGGNLLLEKILSVLFFLFLGIGTVLILSLLLYRIALALMTTSGAASHSMSLRELVRGLASALRRFLLRLSRLSLFPGKRGSRAGRTFRLLMRWGLRSGLPRRRWETPLEYGCRLADRFPGLRAEFLLILETVQGEFYGAIRPTESDTRALRSALRRLRSPVLLPARLRSLFFP